MKKIAAIVRREASLMGLDLSESDLAAITDKWLSDPLCNLRDLLSGIRRLREPDESRKLSALSAALNNLTPK